MITTSSDYITSDLLYVKNDIDYLVFIGVWIWV